MFSECAAGAVAMAMAATSGNVLFIIIFSSMIGLPVEQNLGRSVELPEFRLSLTWKFNSV
jgi:hypothetical protein